MKVKSLSRDQLFPTPWTVAYQAPPSMGFSRQEHWSGLQFPSPTRESEDSQSCPTLSGPMNHSLPGSSIHGIVQARVLEWVAISFSRGSPRPMDGTWVSHIARSEERCREKRKPVHQVPICYKNHCQYFGLISLVEFVFSYTYFYFTTMFVSLVETMLCICIFIYSLYIIGASLEAQM